MGRAMFTVGSVFTVCGLVLAIIWTRFMNDGDVNGLSSNEDEISVVAAGERSLVDMLLQGDYDGDYEGDEYYDDVYELDTVEDGVSEYSNALQYELETWINVIDGKLNSTLDNLQRNVDLKVQSLIASRNESLWIPFLEQWSLSETKQETLIQEYINDIMCVGHWNNETNAMEYYNNAGKSIPQYITRPLMDSLINRSVQELNEYYKKGQLTLNSTLPQQVVELVNTIVQVHIDMFEVWGESVITEWSERMAHNDLIVDKNAIPYGYWKQFLEAKERVVIKHAELSKYEPTTFALSSYTRDYMDILTSTFQQHNSRLTALKEIAEKHFQSRDETEKSS
ncbi:hypothetical protein MOUN0_D05622 [Monosporozyma unispora]